MIPITRKELYLNKIVGNDDYDIPEKPITTEEFFFAEILGEAVQTPEPLSRYQKYLAKIAGRNISVPKPLTRLELFLAKACGMDIETPTPITREEIFWSNYSAIVDFEVEGVPPLTYKAIEGTLENYRIYGNAIDGESVGDRTDNLFSSRLEKGSYDSTTGKPNVITNRVLRSPADDYIYLLPGNYNLSVSGVEYFTLYAYDSPDVNTFNSNLTITNWTQLPSTITINTGAYYKFAFRRSDYAVITPTDISNIMLNEGSTPLPYEPYGYKVPVTVSNGTDTLTTPIYLPEQIRKVGDEAEYIDYGEQKQHRVRKNLWSGIVEQGSVSTNGSYADDIKRIRSKNVPIKPGAYTISCNLAIRCIYAYNNNEKVSCVVDNGGRAIYSNTFIVPSDANNVSIGLRSFDARGAEIDVTTSDFEWGQIEKGSEVTTYEPYIENTDLDVTLPALPTLPGTNVLSVGTAVQPSKVYVKYKGERQ